MPGYKFHGLAATGNRMLTQVDWYSVDSAGALMVAAMGSILFPVGEELRTLPISAESPYVKQSGKHLFNMPENPWIIETIKEWGYSPDVLSSDYAQRVCWNIDMWSNPPWVKKIQPQVGLF